MAQHVITGAPGTGKTTLVDRLAGDVAVVGEPARRIIAEFRRSGEALPPYDQSTAMILEMAIADYLSAPSLALFDRGVPDCLAYAWHLGVDSTPFMAAAGTHRHDGLVFVAEPWEAIYTTDEERRMTFAQVEQFHSAVIRAYDYAGYELISLPEASVETRRAFVLAAIAN